MRLTAIFLALVLASTLVAQTKTTPIHNHSSHAPADLVDGAVHPELIPDSTANRLVLVNLSELPNPTQEQITRQLAFLGDVGLSNTDVQAAIPILTSFKVQYLDSIKQYNESVDLANKNGTTPDLKTFLQELDLLVETTVSELSSAVSGTGMDHIHAYVQREKTKMTIPAKEAIQ